jgi:hypothetical protein
MKYRNGALSPKQARALELLLAGEGWLLSPTL